MSRSRMLLLAAAILAAAASAALAARPPTQAVVQVHDSQASIASFDTASEPTLAGAVRALGVPSACRTIPGLPSFASASWRRLGLRMVFGTYGVLPRKGPCAASNHVRFDSAYLTGHSWRTRGLRVGDSVATLRRRYPRAVRKRYRPGVRPISGWWLVVQVSRVPDLHRFPALLATTSHGRVSGFVVTLGLEGD